MITKIKESRKFLNFAILIGTLSACLIFLFLGQPRGEFGFPLDDAWIHQTYARNLAAQGTWSYSGNEVTGGSTSPLWTMILSIGYIIGQGIPWTFVISILCFMLLVFLSIKIICLIVPGLNNLKVFLCAALFFLEWHLLWSAASGMETILYSLVIVVLMYEMNKQKIRWPVVGAICGLSVWVRPDGLTLLGPVAMIFFFGLIKKQFKRKDILAFLIPFLLFVGIFLLFNFRNSGKLFQNTFYAKQTEYKSLLSTPLLKRIVNEFTQIVTGSGILLLPGFVYLIYESTKKQQYARLAFILWVVGYIILYAIRLPVTYQHGRYVIPVIAPFFILGINGMFILYEKIHNKKVLNLLKFSWIGSLVLVSIGFFVFGINSYRSDVTVINKLMVEPAKWIDKNLDHKVIIGVHDIGAIGYFTKNPVVDLAGLINPEVIPFMNDEQILQRYMEEKHTNYFIGFSDWYTTSFSWGKVIKEFSASYMGKEEKIIIVELKFH